MKWENFFSCADIKMTKYSIAICELFNANIHGVSSQSTPNMGEKILVNMTFSADEFIQNEWIDVLELMKNAYSSYSDEVKQHSSIRNYKNIVEDSNYYRIDLVETEELPGGECVCTIKTNALKRIQRRWKKNHL